MRPGVYLFASELAEELRISRPSAFADLFSRAVD
jgi:hypothetical protein